MIELEGQDVDSRSPFRERNVRERIPGEVRPSFHQFDRRRRVRRLLYNAELFVRDRHLGRRPVFDPPLVSGTAEFFRLREQLGSGA